MTKANRTSIEEKQLVEEGDDERRDFETQRLPAEDTLDGFTLVSEPSRALLNDKQALDYRRHRKDLCQWLLNIGKNPKHGTGYAPDVVKRRLSDTDLFYRWVWSEKEAGYTTVVSHNHGDEYVRKLAYDDYSDSHKSNVVKSLKSLFRWRPDTEEWEPEIDFYKNDSTTPREFLNRKERIAIREASLRYETIPAYKALSPDERQRWKQYLADRLQKSLSAVSPSDFEEAESYKYASLVHTSLDAGLRPIEVKRMNVGWIDFEGAALHIPADESSKNSENWHVSLRDTTAELLREWCIERELYDKYSGTDTVWLTRHGNPYSSGALKYIIEALAEEAGIPTENRSLSWYAIRHSVGTYMTREEGLAAAQTQLRHKSIETTAKYDNVPLEDRRDALNRMG